MISGRNNEKHTTAPRHHIDEDLLLSYAAGTLNESASLLVAAHLTLCPRCRGAVRAAEAVGGVVLEAAEPEAVAPLAAARLDAPAPEAEELTPESLSVLDVAVPRVVARYVPEALRWRFVQPGVKFADLFTDATGARIGFMRAQPGAAITTHGHSGEELTLVLDGGYRDGAATFLRGDVQVCDESTVHTPVTDGDGSCLLLVTIRGPIKPTRWLARLLRPLSGF